jgi:general secretion pathway protein K
MKYPAMTRRGVALIAVLWLVAAMGLIITGIVQAVRGEASSAGLQRHATIANALGDAAILLALQNLQVQQKAPDSTIALLSVPFEGQTFEVSVQPLNGLIDINNAGVVLLEEMYRHAGGLNPGAAQALAQATVDLRQSKSAKGVTLGFDAIEDLLNVPTMTYDLYAKINGLVTADLKVGSGRVNPMAAPAGVLQILTGGDVARAAVLAAGRKADPKLMDTSFLKPELIEMASSQSLRLQVRVGLADGGSLLKTWHVFLGPDPRSGLPWRVLGTQQTILRSAPSDN